MSNRRLFVLTAMVFILFVSLLPAANPVFSPVPALSFVKPFAGADPLPQTVTITSPGANFDFTYAAVSDTGGNWLSVQVVGFNCCVTPRALAVVVTTDPTLAVGTYTGHITFTSFPNPVTSMNVPVVLTVQAAGGTFFDNVPGQVSFARKTGGATITSQQIEIRNGGSGTLNWSLAKSTSDGGDWLTTSASNGVAPSLITLGVAVNNLPGGGSIPGHFIGQVALSQPSGGSVTIPVSVVVGDNILSQINGIHFTKVFGGADPLPQTLTIPSTGTNFDFDYNVYTATGGNWLSIPVVGFNCCITPRALPVVVTTSPTMPVGTYTGQVVFTIEGNGSMAITVPVTLTIEPAGGTFFNNLPGQLSFTMKTGGTTITSQQIDIRNGGAGTLNWSLAVNTSDTGNWLNVSMPSGTAPSQVSVEISAANLPGGGAVAGNFIGQLVFSQPSGGSVTIPVSVVVGNNSFSQVNGIHFTKVFGGADPLPQTLTIPSAGTNFDFDYNVYTATGGNWLSVPVVGFNCCATPRALPVVVTTSPTMPVGTYTGEIVFTAQSNGSMAITVPVTLTIEPADGTFFDALPGQLSFAMKTGGTTITSQQVDIRNGGAGTLSWAVAASTADSGNWLNVSPLNGTAPSQVSVGISAANLPGGGLVAGNFIGQIVFSQPSGGSVTIPVSVVIGNKSFSQVNGIHFTKVFSGADPLPQTLTIPSTGTNFDFDYHVYTTRGGNWLSVPVIGFNCCATPRALPVVVTTSPTMPAGTYTGEIVFTAASNGLNAITVPVTLTIEPTTATFFDDLPGQMSFSLVSGGGNPAMRDVQIRQRGTGTLAWTVTPSTSDGGNWLTVSATNGTGPATVNVGVIASALPGAGLVAGSFVGNLVFNSSSSTTTIPVSVTVGPSVFVQVPTLTFTKVLGGANPPSQDVTIASTGTNFDFNHNWYTATGGNWLSVTVAGFNCCATPRAITATINAPTLAAGTYTGQIVTTITGNGSMAMTIPVILTVIGPAITSVTPNTGQVGQTLTSVAIAGQNTNFVQGTTVASFGAGITVNSLTINSATSATANITIQPGATPGQRTVTMTTGGEVASLADGFSVLAPLDVVSFSVLFGSQSYNVAAPGVTRVRLPWQIKGIQVVFSRPIVSGDANSIGGVVSTGFTGLGTNTLTWSISPVAIGNLAITLAGNGPHALADASGVFLGGGLGYTRNMKVLFGDFNDDGFVTSADLVGINNATVAAYNPFADINGDGIVNVQDVSMARTRIGTSLR